MVDTLGLILIVVVHSAGVQDRDGAKLVFEQLLKWSLSRLQFIWADGDDQVVGWLKALAGGTLEIVRRCDDLKGFHVRPKRCIVERTFGWLVRFRHMTRDYEETTRRSEAWIHLMARRHAPT